MSIENVKKLELGMDMSCNCEKYIASENLSDEIIQQLIDKGGKLEEEAMSSGDEDVLERAFDYFLEEENDIALNNGGCESLENEIFQYFTFEQIAGVLNHKLSKLIELNISRAKHFAGACISHGYLEEFRDVLKAVSSKKLKNSLIEECDKWIGEDYPDEIAILRKDIND